MIIDRPSSYYRIEECSLLSLVKMGEKMIILDAIEIRDRSLMLFPPKPRKLSIRKIHPLISSGFRI